MSCAGSPSLTPSVQFRTSDPYPCSQLRRRLETQLIPDDENVPEHKKFFPVPIITSIVTDRVIGSVLQCWCTDCQSQRPVRQRQLTTEINQILGRGNGNNGCSVLVFSILAFIEYPSLVTRFLDRNITDCDLVARTADFTTEYVCQILGPDISPRIASKFSSEKWKFVVPPMDDGKYEEYPECTILPFVDEWIGDGAFGNVFRIRFLDGYGHFPAFPSIKYFARKELKGRNRKNFRDEFQNLKLVSDLADPHLIKLVKAYKHGNYYNFIFPLAKTNLHEYLRKPTWQPYANSGSLIDHPIWHQALGLARGLNKVLDVEHSRSPGSPSMFGYHLDLKPANILVDDLEGLIITDFGQAAFKTAAGATSSNVRGRGGTEAYAPPEIDSMEICCNRKYDVWSLGCVFLELITFIVKGQSGVRELDELRTSPVPVTFHTDDRFFQLRCGTRSTFELKPQIKEHFKSLLLGEYDELERQFIESFIKLILVMLQVDLNRRINSADVCVYISELLKRFRYSRSGNTSLAESSMIAEMEALRCAEEFGTNILRYLQPISYSIARQPDRGHIKLLQDKTRLIIQSVDEGGRTTLVDEDRSSIGLIPEYAIFYPGMSGFSDATMCISSKLPAQESHQRCRFSFRKDIKAVTAMQEALLGQEAVISGKIRGATLDIKQKIKLTKWRTGTSSGSIQFAPMGNASAIQLWRETSHRDIGQMSLARVSKRLSLKLAPAHRRVILFFERSIVTIRLARNVRIERDTEKSGPSSSVLFVPNDKKIFSVAIIQAQKPSEFPAIPLAIEELETLEETNCVECRSLRLDFYSVEEAKLFCVKYKQLKKQWTEECKQVESRQQEIGFDFQYTRKVS